MEVAFLRLPSDPQYLAGLNSWLKEDPVEETLQRNEAYKSKIAFK